MFFFAAVTLIGLVWSWFFLPELAGKSLEAVDRVFELPWYMIGRKGKELTEGMGGAVEGFRDDGEKTQVVETVEDVGTHREGEEKRERV